jgi:DNA repair protein SbcD/Mre11
MKFAHIADVHLGGWKQKPLQDLNFQSFRKTIDRCIKEKVQFALIAGDLFDNPYPSIEVLKDTFAEFKKLKDNRIPCYIIAGSHDYSVSGKTFLDVLEKAGFCKNVEDWEEKDGKLILNPTVHEGVAFYGYPGKKSGLEVKDLRRIKLNDAPGMFKIFMLHTTLDKAKGNLPIDSIEAHRLPEADYYALGHLHIDFKYQNFVYPGPVFPNNFAELEDLHFGRFYIVDTEADQKLTRIDLKIKEIESIKIKVQNAVTATDEIISEINTRKIEDKIVLLRVIGELENGKHSDIKFAKIEEHLQNKGAYFMLKNTHKLKIKEPEFEIDVKDTENVEEETIKVYSEENPSDLNELIPSLIMALSIEKQEGETNEVFNNRLIEDTKKVLSY